MSTQINQAIFDFGKVEAQFFNKDCQARDWKSWEITFAAPFPTDDVRVIVTANDYQIDAGLQNIAAVGIAQNVTQSGFTLAARNSDCAHGSAGFNWMAVLETPGQRQDGAPDLRLGIVQPRFFQPDCVPGDWQVWESKFHQPFADSPVILLTGSNLHVQGHNPAVVGVVQNPIAAGFSLAARSSDCQEGNSSLYYVALSQETAGQKDLWIDSGQVFPLPFDPDCTHGDWHSWEVYFHQSFLTPPVVLVTPNNRGVEGHNSAVVGIAQNVTSYGFTLAARNSDCAGGQAGFYWVAIGCAKGCG